jgi:hypothetical protein
MRAINYYFLRMRFKQILCLILIFLQAGCGSAYQLNLHTKPSGATVRAGSNFLGETPCKIKIPKDSTLIREHYLDITYSLPDGRRMTKTYDLRDYEPPNELPGWIAATFIVPGLLIFSLTETDEDDKFSPFDKEDDDEYNRQVRWIASGSVGLGILVFYIFYGDARGLEGYDILEKFDDANDVTVNVSSQDFSIEKTLKKPNLIQEQL